MLAAIPEILAALLRIRKMGKSGCLAQFLDYRLRHRAQARR
jgi:hypothetical protein